MILPSTFFFNLFYELTGKRTKNPNYQENVYWTLSKICLTAGKKVFLKLVNIDFDCIVGA